MVLVPCFLSSLALCKFFLIILFKLHPSLIFCCWSVVSGDVLLLVHSIPLLLLLGVTYLFHMFVSTTVSLMFSECLGAVSEGQPINQCLKETVSSLCNVPATCKGYLRDGVASRAFTCCHAEIGVVD